MTSNWPIDTENGEPMFTRDETLRIHAGYMAAQAISSSQGEYNMSGYAAGEKFLEVFNVILRKLEGR